MRLAVVDQYFFRKILWIGAAACFALSAVTVALRFSGVGAHCAALVGTPLPIILTVAVTWQAAFWRSTRDQIAAVKARVDDMGLSNPLMDAIDTNILLMIVVAFFIGIAALPLILFLVQCA